MAKETKPNDTLKLYRMHCARVNDRKARELAKAVSAVAGSVLTDEKGGPEKGAKVTDEAPANPPDDKGKKA